MTKHTNGEIAENARKIDIGEYQEIPEQEQQVATQESGEANPDESAGILESAKSFIRQNPGPAFLFAAGAAWMMVNAERRREESLRKTITDRTQVLQERAGEVREQTSAKLEDLRSTTSERLDEAREITRDRMSSLQQRYEDTLESAPLLLGLGAFAAGLILGAMAPVTPTEHRVLGPQRDRLMQQAQQIVKEAQEVAHQSIVAAKETASENLQEIKEELKTTAQEVAKQAKETARDELDKRDFTG